MQLTLQDFTVFFKEKDFWSSECDLLVLGIGKLDSEGHGLVGNKTWCRMWRRDLIVRVVVSRVCVIKSTV